MTSLSRWWTVARGEVATGIRRPGYYVLLALLVFLAWGMSKGAVVIASGDATVGGDKSWVTSMFAQANIQTVVIAGIGAWFLAIGCGLVIIRDGELNVGEILHATRLRAGEYIWGKFAGAIIVFCLVWLVYLLLTIGFNHGLTTGEDAERIGPFVAWNYVMPTLVFGIPQILFFGGVSFYLGARTRRPIVVFAFPIAVLLIALGFLISWSPSWLDPAVNRALMLIDPSGFRWLNETFLKVDRGVEFYNTAAIRPDAGILASRGLFALLGLLAVHAASRSYASALRTGAVPISLVGRLVRRLRRRGHAPEAAESEGVSSGLTRGSLKELGMVTAPLGLFRGAWVVLRSEVKDMVSRPGMYLFVPLIVIQAVQQTLLAVGPFDSQVLLTPGAAAASQANTLSLLVCLLLLFYTVESLHKERALRMDGVYYAAPVRTGSILVGKTLGTSLVAAFILGAGVLATAAIILWRQWFDGSPVGFDFRPFVLGWGGVLLPTFVFWTALITALFSLLRSRYAVYALGIFLIGYTVYRQSFAEPLGWVFNWMAWGGFQWSDMGPFSLKGDALRLNRLLYLALSVPLTVLAMKWFGRQEFDANRIIHRIRPRSLFVAGLRLLPFAAPALVIASALYFQGREGFQGPAAEKAAKDYWRRNQATWTDFAMPSVSHVDLDVDFEPAEHRAVVEGAYTFVNHRGYSYPEIPITAGDWDELEWTLDGESVEPDDRANLFIFTPAEPLAPGDSLTVGFSYALRNPRGLSKQAGGQGQFILESGIVLGSFGPSLVPTPGYSASIGVDEDNSYDSRDYADDFYVGETEPLFGWGGRPFTARMAFTVPEDFTANGVGRLVSDRTVDGRRTMVWETDHPVGFFNVVAARYAVKEGDGTALYYHPEHDYNVEEMSSALDAARRYYSEWFYPFPWETLKVSEFPGFATYAQGFPTNITFSEGIGFLARSDPRSHVAFMVVAHEAAHQWWGNLLTPGQGPGGNMLSEGMAHYSTILLHDQVLGEQYRIEFTKRIEQQYGDQRVADTERSLVKTDDTRPGDQTVRYDKGGWVMWMLQQRMGREALLSGLQSFIAKYNPDPDFPVIQDMLAVLRDFAPDTLAFDEFAGQWFHDVVVPEYRFEDVTREERDGAWVVRGTVWNDGTGTMPLDIAVASGERFPEEDDGRSGAATDASEPAATYRDARASVIVGAGESVPFEIRSTFEPDRVLVDPDVLVLQLNRERAVHSFDGS